MVGIVTLPHLLAGRRRDQQEARDRERHLTIRLLGSTSGRASEREAAAS